MCGGKKKRESTNAQVLPPPVSEDFVMESAIPHIVKQQELEKMLKDARKDQLLVLDFYGKWCGPCVRIAPIVERWVSEFPDVQFVKVDVDNCDSNFPEFYNIQSIPTFLLFKNGNKVAEYLGSKHPPLKQMIEQHRSSDIKGNSDMDPHPTDPPTKKLSKKNTKTSPRASKNRTSASANRDSAVSTDTGKELTHVQLPARPRNTEQLKKKKSSTRS